MLYFSFSRIAAVCFGLFFIILPFAAAQDISAEAAIPAEAENEVADEGIEPLRISVDVQEVRLDVVVLDWRGRPITDLTVDNFEVYQDNRQVEVTSSVYVDLTESSAEPAPSRKDSPYLPKVPVATLKEEDVGRTILFVVDNVAAGFGPMNYAKMSINRFLERQMLPNDLVGVIHTGPGNSALNVFSSDKRHLSARVGSLQNLGFGGNQAASSDEPLDDKLQIVIQDVSSYEFDGFRHSVLHRVYSSQLAVLSYGIRAMKDMPGRKTVLLLTENPTLAITSEEDYKAIYGPRFEKLADDALAAGVVVHTMNIKGLEVFDIEGNFVKYANSPRYGLNPLPIRTGGLAIENNNFFLDGIGSDVSNMLSGYYLISYIPPPGTFDLDKKGNEVYHRVQVKVKGRYANIYTRHGFYGNKESGNEDGEPAHPLQKALFSPFLHAEINVSIAAGYVKGRERIARSMKGDTPGIFSSNESIVTTSTTNIVDYLARSWIHVDPKDVTIVETEDGGARIALKIICVTTDARGGIHDGRLEQYIYNIEAEKKSETIAWIQKHGIRFSMLLPVKKPGFYTVRLGLQDMESGKLGSAWQLVEIPDLAKKPMALSSVFMIVNNEDLAWMNADVTKELTEGLFFPTISEANVRTPALRVYMPGDELRTLTMLYNVDVKAATRNEIEVQTVLYKDGVEYLRGEARPITADEAKNPGGVQILRKLTMGGDMPPGDYVLQVLVIDKAIRAKEDKPKGILSKIFGKYIGDTFTDYNEKAKGVASETLSFRVVADF